MKIMRVLKMQMSVLKSRPVKIIQTEGNDIYSNLAL